MNLYISIIIPVYNTANYVARTLNSIIQQNFDGYEIILIDDGSRDNSNNICKQYAATYPHIIFIEKGKRRSCHNKKQSFKHSSR